jgi:hypothetical protein
MPGAIRGAGQWAEERLWLAIIAAAILIAVLAETRAQPSTGDEALVSAAETALGDALHAGDKSAARRLLSLQFTFTSENGKVLQRKEFLSALKNFAAMGPASDVRVKIYGLVAMVIGTRKSSAGGNTLFLDIWAKQKGSWRTLTIQDVVLGTPDNHPARPEAPPDAETKPERKSDAKSADAKPDKTSYAKSDAKPYECKNPCEVIPYRVRSPAEQDIITTFQQIARAAVAHDAGEWAKHVADDFTLYRSGYPPVAKSEIITTIGQEKKSNIAVAMSEIANMRLSVYGDGAAMIADHISPDNSRLPYRAASVWAKRNGQWLLEIDVETDVKNP